MRSTWVTGLVAGFMLVAAQAHASPLTVNATDSIYGASNSGYGATDPVSVMLNSGATSLSFSSVTGSITTNCASSEGCISLNNGGNYNNPDGVGAEGGSYNSGTLSLSGITLPNAGALVGVFLSGSPTGLSPTALDFTTGAGTSFTSLSPLIDQVFFIGDGLTGNGTGSTQTFYVPTGATTLDLGIADACGYNGGPSCYGDNLGSYGVTVNQQGGSVPVPEPASVVTLAVGMLGLLGVSRLRRTRA